MICSVWRRRQLRGGASIILPTYIYYADGNNGVNSGRLGRANYPDGSAAGTIVSNSGAGIRQIAVAGGFVYYALAGGIGRCNLDGTGNNAAWFALSGVNGGVAVTSSFIYFTTNTTISRCNLDGSGVTTLVSGASTSAQSIAVDGSHIYWGTRGPSSVMRANLDGSGVTTLLGSLPSDTDGVQVDASFVYYLMDNGNIGRANLDGSGRNNSWVSTGAAIPQQLFVGSAYVYWGTYTASKVGRVNIDGTGVNGSFLTATGYNVTGVGVA